MQAIDSLCDIIPDQMSDFLDVESIFDKLVDRLVGSPIDRGPYDNRISIARVVRVIAENSRIELTVDHKTTPRHETEPR